MGRETDRDGHVLVVAGPQESADLLAPWVKQGLRVDDRVICARPDADVPGTSLALLTEDERTGPLFRSAAATGQLLILPASEFYPPGKVEGLADAARKDGYAGVRMIGEAVTALALLGPRGYQRLENDFEALTLRSRTGVWCIYDPDRVPAELTCGHAHLHRDGVQSAMFRLTSSARSAHLTGELDSTLAGIVEAALHDLLSHLPGLHLTLEISGLTFCDAAGARALLSGTAAARARGVTIWLMRPTGAVRRVLALTGVPEADGLEVVAARP
jgi:anti-anti-sigma factor